METVLDIFSWSCLITGSFFCLTGGVGLLRFPDFFSRIHSASLTDTLGASLILIGLMFQAGWGIVSAKLILILVFSLLVGTTASHAMAKAAMKSGLEPLVAAKKEEQSGEAASKPSLT